MKKLILTILFVFCLTNISYAWGDLERGLLIGAGSIIGLQLISNPDRTYYGDRYYDYSNRYYSNRYYDRGYISRSEWEYVYGYRATRGPRCIYETQYDPRTHEPIGYRKFCR